MSGNPKILLIQHSPMSLKDNNGKTAYKLLSQWKPEELCQIYFTSQEPDMSLCSSYYHLSGREVLYSYFTKQSYEGNVYSGDSKSNGENNAIESYQSRFLNKVIHTRFGLLLQSRAWESCKALSNPQIMNWVSGEHPKLIVLGASDIPYILRGTLRIAQQLNLPLAIMVGDNYYQKSRGNIIYSRCIRNAFAKCVDYSSGVIAISQDMVNKLKNEFGGKYIIAMNTIELSEEHSWKPLLKNSIDIVYTGNIGIGRWQSICYIGNILRNVDATIHVYTNGDISTHVRRELKKTGNIEIHNPVFGEELYKVIESCDLVLFAEGFDRSNKSKLETAMSTKIPEYLFSKRAILAIGPAYSAAVNYLNNKKVACVIDNKKDIKDSTSSITRLLDDDDYRNEMTRRAYKLAKRDFDGAKVSEATHGFLLSMIV